MALSDTKLRSMLGKTFDGKRPKRIADRDGLNVLWRPSGKLTWVYRYRFNDKQQEIAIGKYTSNGSGVGLKDAREKAAECRRWLDDGLDPKVQIKLRLDKSIEFVTVKDALEYWLNEYCLEKRANVDKHRSQFRKHIYPYLGDLPLESCDTSHWVACFDRIRKGDKSIKQRAAPVAAGYVFQNVKQALRFCRVRQFAISNAIDDLNVTDVGSKQGAKDRFLSNDELKVLLKWLDDGKMQNYYRNLIYLLVVFGARSQELRMSTISEWDLTNRVWTVPKEHSKTDEIIIRAIPERLVPYLDLLIKDAKCSSTNLLLGELKSPEAVSAWGGGIWKKIGHSEPWTLHDLRRTFSTNLNDMRIPPHIVEKLLGHKMGGVMAIYNRSQYIEEKHEAMNKWFSYLN